MRRILIVLMLLLSVLALAACGAKEEAVTEEGAAHAVKQDETAEEGLAWHDYSEGMALAGAEGKYVLVDFWTTWCKWCKVMDTDTYSDETVQARLAESFVAIKVNAESDEAQGAGDAPSGRALAGQYQVSSFPTTWFVDPQGQKIAPLPGFMPPEQFVVVLDFISTGAYQNGSFQEYQASLDKSEG